MAVIPTPAEVTALTGVTVEQVTIDVAATYIEVYSGRHVDLWPHLSASDQRTLKLALAFQAAWLHVHPEALTAMDVASFGQLDQNVSYHEDAARTQLSALTRRLLKQLSWKGIRSVSVTTDFQRGGVDDDHAGAWSPLP